MNASDMVTLSLEGTFSILLLTIAYKLYKMKIKPHSGCCLKENNGVILDTQNSGVSSEDDIINKI